MYVPGRASESWHSLLVRASCRTNSVRIFPHGGTNFGANSCANFRTNISGPFSPFEERVKRWWKIHHEIHSRIHSQIHKDNLGKNSDFFCWTGAVTHCACHICFLLGQENKYTWFMINILGGTVFGKNRNHPWDKQDQSLGQTGRFLFHSTVKSSFFVSFVPWTGVGSTQRAPVKRAPEEK